MTAAVKPLGVKTPYCRSRSALRGHAMLVARRAIPARAKICDSFCFRGMRALIRTETVAALATAHRESGAAATILSAEIENPAGYGAHRTAG